MPAPLVLSYSASSSTPTLAASGWNTVTRLSGEGSKTVLLGQIRIEMIETEIRIGIEITKKPIKVHGTATSVNISLHVHITFVIIIMCGKHFACFLKHLHIKEQLIYSSCDFS